MSDESRMTAPAANGNYLLHTSHIGAVDEASANKRDAFFAGCPQNGTENVLEHAWSDPRFVDVSEDRELLEAVIRRIVVSLDDPESDAFRGLLLFWIQQIDVAPLLAKLGHRRGNIFVRVEALVKEFGKDSPMDAETRIADGVPAANRGPEVRLDSPMPILTALALGHLACRAGGAALFVLDDEEGIGIRRHGWMRDTDAWEALDELEFALVSPRHYIDESQNEWDEWDEWDEWTEPPRFTDIVAGLTLRRRIDAGHAQRGFKSFAGREMRSTPVPTRAEFGHLGFDPFREAQNWVDTEFMKVSLRNAFYTELVAKTVEKVPTMSRTQAIGVILAAVRVCRKLAYESLETSEFDCNVFLPFNETTFKNSFSKVLDPDPDCRYLNFDYYDSLKDYCELAQSDRMVVAASIFSGRMLGIFKEKKPSEADHHRQQRLAGWSKDSGILIHLGHRGRVEVYSPRASEASESICLFTGGSEWNHSPSVELESRLKEYFSDDDDHSQSLRDTLFAAIFGLLEARESSIIVFLDRDDVGIEDGAADLDVLADREETPEDRRKRLLYHQIRELRNRIRPDNRPLITELRSENLQTLLRADGAHCINREGRIVALGLQILPKQKPREADREKDGDSGVPEIISFAKQTKEPGSGGAAMKMVEKIPIFSGSKSIKVSSSGRLKFSDDR